MRVVVINYLLECCVCCMMPAVAGLLVVGDGDVAFSFARATLYRGICYGSANADLLVSTMFMYRNQGKT